MLKGMFAAALAAGESLFRSSELFFNCLGQLLMKSFSKIWSCFAALQKSPLPQLQLPQNSFLSHRFWKSNGFFSWNMLRGRTAFLRRFRAPDGLPPAIPSPRRPFSGDSERTSAQNTQTLCSFSKLLPRDLF
ncbi:hypothetical protein KSP39_PZI012708 [Platanthera zijinensis]|uniref:Uncharacterized protein n=1 Tax=Platanthera zijinensis TaxID=2320716 RepID=A0AAP0BE18_9ASPA